MSTFEELVAERVAALPSLRTAAEWAERAP
jgi:hypothetical protein